MEIPPELYLSLLSGYGDLLHTSTESGHGDIGSRISRHPSAADPKRIMDLLDALAAVCVRKEKGETFFVSLAMVSDSTTLYISSNHTVPANIAHYLVKIRNHLKNLHDVLEFPSITTSNETSPNPNVTPQRTEGELGLQTIIYEHTYLKLRQRFFKRAPAILKEYPAIEKQLTSEGITTEEATLLQNIKKTLRILEDKLQSEKLPAGAKLHFLITGIAAIAADKRLKGGIVTRWDDLIRTKFNPAQTRILSLGRLLEKLSILHRHIWTITRVAWSRRFSQFLTGKFQVVAVPPDRHNISIKFSRKDVLSITFPPGNQTKQDVQSRVYDALMARLKVAMEDDELGFQKGNVPQLSMDVSGHAECTLLAYHVQNCNTSSHWYFGGSKLSCHGCATFFTSYNRVAASLSLPQFFTRDCHNKVYLRWACPSLLSAVDQIRLRDKGPTLDTQVRKEMVDILRRELAQYVEGLCEIETTPSPTQTDSTDASADSQLHGVSTVDEFVEAVDRFDDALPTESY